MCLWMTNAPTEMVFPSLFIFFSIPCLWMTVLCPLKTGTIFLSEFVDSMFTNANSCLRADNFAFKRTVYFTKQIISKTTNQLAARLTFNCFANSTHYDISSDKNSFQLTYSQNCSLPPSSSFKNARHFRSSSALDVIGTLSVTAQTTQHVFHLTSLITRK